MDRARADPAGAIAVGPFETPPFGLGRLVTGGFTDRPAGEITSATAAWLTTRLEAARVVLGAHDIEIVHELAEDLGWDAAQVVGGWVARAG